MKAPMFTKRHYRVIAKAVHAALAFQAAGPSYAGDPLARRLAGRAAECLRGTNPNFDETRFIEACLDGCDRARGNAKVRHPIR